MIRSTEDDSLDDGTLQLLDTGMHFFPDLWLVWPG